MATLDGHDEFTDRLSDYLDVEDLSASERAEIAAHLATCRECRTTLSELRDIASRARSVTDVSPTSDLWPGIAERLTARSSVAAFVKPAPRRFSFTMPQLVAAGLALMVLSGGLVWIARLNDPRASLPPAVAQTQADERVEAPDGALETARIRSLTRRMSTRTGPSSTRPYSAARRTMAATLALATRVLVGMHPVLTQVPPGCPRSSTATFQPSPAMRRASEGLD